MRLKLGTLRYLHKVLCSNHALHFENPLFQDFTEGKVVFTDILGKFMVLYTERQALIINLCVAAAFLVVLGLSLVSMTSTLSHIPMTSSFHLIP
jgi:hypothetical protein